MLTAALIEACGWWSLLWVAGALAGGSALYFLVFDKIDEYADDERKETYKIIACCVLVYIFICCVVPSSENEPKIRDECYAAGYSDGYQACRYEVEYEYGIVLDP